MKTKFFKKLSFVLVVAMVLSLFVPAAGVFAAGKPSLNFTKTKYLHLGRADNGQNEFNFNIKNKKSGWKYFWESNKENIVEVNEKNGVVTATGVGKAKVMVTITDKDGEKVTTLTANVTVRDNIKEVTISNPVEKLAVGEAHDYNRSYVTEANSTKKTSAITRWTVEPADKASIDDKGVFVATEAGEYTVTALSFQSKAKYNDWLKDAEKYATNVLDTDETKVVVAGSMVDAKQYDLDTVTVTFDSAMEDVDKNISIYQVVGTTKVKQNISKVEMDDAKKVASVSLYIPFAKGSTFQIEYPDMDAVSFVAATTKPEDVASMRVHTTTAVVNVEKEVEVKLFNAAGVDITTPDLLLRVAMKSANEAGTWFNADTKKVLIFEVGKTTVITATYQTYKYDNAGKPIGNIEAVGTIIGVDKDATNITGLAAWTMVPRKSDGTYDVNFYDVKQILAADDYNYRLFVKLDEKTGNNPSAVESNDATKSSRFDYTSSDKSILIVDQLGNLYPVKEGTVTVVVKYAAAGDKVPVATVTINVGPKKAASIFTLSTYEFSLSNTLNLGGTGDYLDVKLTMKDQAERAFNFTKYNIERLSAPLLSNGTMTTDQLVPATGDVTMSTTNGEHNVRFNANNRLEGTYVYKITVENISRVVTINVVKANATTPSYYRLVLDTNSKDMKIESWTGLPVNVGIKLFGYSSNGVKVVDVDLTNASDDFKIEIEAPWDPNGKFASHKRDNNTDLRTQYYSVAVTGSATGVTGSVIYKAPVGSYKVTAYGPVTENGSTTVKALDTVYFTTTDTQSPAVLSEIKSQVFNGTLTDADVANSKSTNLINAVAGDANNGLKFKVDGGDVSIVDVEAVGTGNMFAVKSVTVRKLFKGTAGTADAVYLDYKVNVGLTFERKN